LIKKGADPNSAYKSSGNSLSWAIVSGELEIVKYLIENGADPNIKDTIEIVLLKGDIKILKFIIANGGDKNKYLAEISFCDHLIFEKLEYLVSIGADINYIKEDFYIRCGFGIEEGSCTIIKYLIEHGARSKAALEQAKKCGYNDPTAGAQVICNKFKLFTKVKGSIIDLSVDTDLPDNTVVMISVSRSYMEKDNPSMYSVDYFSEKSTVGKWKSKHRIFVDSEKWKSALRAKQEEMSRLGLGFDVASISDKITMCMVVPINQPDPQFGKRNSKLTGKVVKATGLCFVEDEIEIDYPLKSPPVGKSPFLNLNPLELEVGQSYIVTKQTSLMPAHSPIDIFAALLKVKYIPKGGGFKVLDTFDKKSNPWYRVNAFDQRKKQIGEGWINSLALLGKTLRHTNNPLKREK